MRMINFKNINKLVIYVMINLKIYKYILVNLNKGKYEKRR